jgi:hypothetical protein
MQPGSVATPRSDRQRGRRVPFPAVSSGPSSRVNPQFFVARMLYEAV